MKTDVIHQDGAAEVGAGLNRQIFELDSLGENRGFLINHPF